MSIETVILGVAVYVGLLVVVLAMLVAAGRGDEAMERGTAADAPWTDEDAEARERGRFAPSASGESPPTSVIRQSPVG
jgi:hypothetical protein